MPALCSIGVQIKDWSCFAHSELFDLHKFPKKVLHRILIAIGLTDPLARREFRNADILTICQDHNRRFNVQLPDPRTGKFYDVRSGKFIKGRSTTRPHSSQDKILDDVLSLGESGGRSCEILLRFKTSLQKGLGGRLGHASKTEEGVQLLHPHLSYLTALLTNVLRSGALEEKNATLSLMCLLLYYYEDYDESNELYYKFHDHIVATLQDTKQESLKVRCVMTLSCISHFVAEASTQLFPFLMAESFKAADSREVAYHKAVLTSVRLILDRCSHTVLRDHFNRLTTHLFDLISKTSELYFEAIYNLCTLYEVYENEKERKLLRDRMLYHLEEVVKDDLNRKKPSERKNLRHLVQNAKKTMADERVTLGKFSSGKNSCGMKTFTPIKGWNEYSKYEFFKFFLEDKLPLHKECKSLQNYFHREILPTQNSFQKKDVRSIQARRQKEYNYSIRVKMNRCLQEADNY